VLQIPKTQGTGFLLQRGNQALIQTYGSPALAANGMVVVMGGLLAQKEFFSAHEDLLDQTGFQQGVQNPVDRGAVTSLVSNPSMDLVRDEGATRFRQGLQNRPATRSGL